MMDAFYVGRTVVKPIPIIKKENCWKETTSVVEKRATLAKKLAKRSRRRVILWCVRAFLKNIYGYCANGFIYILSGVEIFH